MFRRIPLLSRFARAEHGAVTVDWTVLAASVVGLGLTSAAAVRVGTGSLGGDIEASLTAAHVAGTPLLRAGFDNTDGLTVTSWGWRARGSFDGWAALTTDGDFEIIRSGYAGVVSPDGTNMLDMGGSPGNLQMARPVEGLAPGSAHTIALNAADIRGDNRLEVRFGGVLVGTVEAGRAMSEYRFEITAGMGDGSDTLTLAETGNRDNTGTYVHDIRVY